MKFGTNEVIVGVISGLAVSYMPGVDQLPGMTYTVIPVNVNSKFAMPALRAGYSALIGYLIAKVLKKTDAKSAALIGAATGLLTILVSQSKNTALSTKVGETTYPEPGKTDITE